MSDKNDLLANVQVVSLQKRQDRRDAMLAKWHEKGFGQLTFFDAIEHEMGHYGCAQSHARVLEQAIEANAETVVVLEDDFEWRQSHEQVVERLNECLAAIGDEWDVLLLTAGAHTFRGEETAVDGLFRAKSAQTASGYIVNGAYLRTLQQRFQQGVDMLRQVAEATPEERKHSDVLRRKNFDGCCDQIWKSLQARDRWYAFAGMAQQAAGFSDIERRNVQYKFL